MLLKCEAMASYTRCTYSSSRRAASAWQQGSEGGDGGGGARGATWLSQAEGKAGGEERGGGPSVRRALQLAIFRAEFSLKRFDPSINRNTVFSYWTLCACMILTTAAGFVSDLAECEGRAGVPLAQR